MTNAAGSGFGTATVGSLVYLAGGLGSTWLLARFIDHRPFADYDFHFNRAWWLDLGFGLFLGAFLLTGIFLTEKVAGWIAPTVTMTTADPLPFALAFLFKLLVYLAVGVNEELAFRGYQLKNLAEGLAGKRIGPRAAIVLAFVISSLLFSLGHITNENSTTLSTLNLVLGGLMLSLPFLLTGELAASIGLHITWNLFEGTVYGFAVSGSLPSTHLLTTQQTGPELFTGGAFGPEAGLVYIFWALAGCGLIIAWVQYRRKQLSLYLPLASYTPPETINAR
jgi:membrane protease YdiL (CAAX protease family)